MPERPADQPDINPAVVSRDPLLGEIADMLAYVDLHLGRFVWKQLTTRQKELLADLVDSHCVLDPLGPDESPRRVVRWWRDSYDGPTGPEDTRWHDHEHREPDPFRYADPTLDTGDPDHAPPVGTSTRLRPTLDHQTLGLPDGGAVRLARSATLGDQHDPALALWLVEDQAAVYEWAKRAVRPFRRAIGAQAGEINEGMTVYPSLTEARAFLATYRAARTAAHDEQG